MAGNSFLFNLLGGGGVTMFLCLQLASAWEVALKLKECNYGQTKGSF